jgi:hypothetical protein
MGACWRSGSRKEANPNGMSERYKEDRLYCTTCKEQPDSFLEVIHRQVNVVNRDGKQICTKDTDLEYECPQCEDTASWGHELNP